MYVEEPGPPPLGRGLGWTTSSSRELLRALRAYVIYPGSPSHSVSETELEPRSSSIPQLQ